MSTPKPSIERLWQQAKGDGDRYRDLMRQHGYILSPGDDGYGEGSRTLACGWPGTVADGHPPWERIVASLVRQSGRQACVYDADAGYETGTLGIHRASDPGRWLLAVRDAPPGDPAPPARPEAAGALLGLADEIDSIAGRPRLPGVESGAYRYSRGILRGIAELARRRAAEGPGTPLSGEPAAVEAPAVQDGTGPLCAPDGIAAAAAAMQDVIDDAQVVIGLKDRLARAARGLEIAGRDAVEAERDRAEAEHARYLARLTREMDATLRTERQRRNVVITACQDPGCGDGCDCGG